MSTIAVVGLRAVSIANKSRLDPLYTTLCAVFYEVPMSSHTCQKTYIRSIKRGNPGDPQPTNTDFILFAKRWREGLAFARGAIAATRHVILPFPP